MKILKYGAEDMLSGSLTEVMSMPKHRVRRCGLKDLQLGTSAMAMAWQMVKAGASAAEDQTIVHHPGSEWFDLKAAVVVFMLGSMAGTYLMHETMATGVRKNQGGGLSDCRLRRSSDLS